MSISVDKKRKFLSEFQDRVIQARRLLQSGNHHWASKLLQDLYFDIETKEWLNAQKKHQLILVLSNSYWIYVNSLKKKNKEEMDLIKYVDAYKRFFSFLTKLEDFNLFEKFATRLLQSFIEMEDLSIDGITQFINSFSIKVIEQRDYLKLIELQVLLMYLRKSVIPTDYFRSSMEYLGRIIYKLEPGKRALFLYVILENVNIKFELLKDSEEFIHTMNKVLVNRIPNYLRDTFSNLSRIKINQGTFSSIKEDLIWLIQYLNNIGEASWIIIIIRALFNITKNFQSFGDAIVLTRQFIEYSINRNNFIIAFEIYNFLEDLFMLKSDLSYDNVSIELWAEACKTFVNMKEKKYLLQSIEKLTNHLTTPQKPSQIFHYFYTCNYLWKFKTMFFSLEKRDFWRMIFYRALYEQNDLELARSIIPYLGKRMQPLLENPEKIYEETKELKNQIYLLDEKEQYAFYDKEFDIKNIIIRIRSSGKMSYRILSLKNDTLEGNIENEYWNDMHILDIYNEMFSNDKQKEYDFNLREFGKILFLLLPKLIRDFFTQFKVRSLDYIPHVYFILDHMTIPFELIYDGNFFLLKYSSGYNIGEPPIGGFDFTYKEHESSSGEESTSGQYKALIIDSINTLGPKIWNEDLKGKELLFPFPAGANELDFITRFLSQRTEIESLDILSGRESTRDKILDNISSDNHHIIYIIGNIFYSELNPQNSYFLTNDRNIVKFTDIFEALKENNKTKPILFFNTQLYDNEGNHIEDELRSFGEIISNFITNNISGIISRNYAIFNDESKKIIANFFSNIFERKSLGVALLKSRQKCIADRTTKFLEEKISKSKQSDEDQHINIENSQTISSFILYGEPWKKMNPK
ncbi:MAG: hypothetical protein GF311_03775 [Candidatus Lokiarchaeota archaeon]|nr:hypothetical protein [Candidatus Lokiarchaeota archaeon]